MAEWTNPCDAGFGKEPVRTYRLSMDVGSRFGGSVIGMCPAEGCGASVGKNGRLKKHEMDPGGYMRRYNAQVESNRASRARGIDPDDPRHTS